MKALFLDAPGAWAICDIPAPQTTPREALRTWSENPVTFRKIQVEVSSATL